MDRPDGSSTRRRLIRWLVAGLEVLNIGANIGVIAIELGAFGISCAGLAVGCSLLAKRSAWIAVEPKLTVDGRTRITNLASCEANTRRTLIEKVVGAAAFWAGFANQRCSNADHSAADQARFAVEVAGVTN